MPCDPNANKLNIRPAQAYPIPGFGLPFAPIQLPIPGFKLPDGFPESIMELLEKLRINWPGGPILPQIDNFAATLLKGIMDLFGQLMPFLSFYNFIMALLNMILCIIEVFCAMPNPFKMIKAFRKLIRDCLPPFLNLFPWMALIAMIISLILLLLALIGYIIARILEIISDVIANLILLSEGLTLQDAEATVAVAFKISSLFCIIENLMAMLGAVAAIFAIIEALAQFGGNFGCFGNGDEDAECCGDDVCPPFISENPNGIVGTQGRIIYYRQVVDSTQVSNPMFDKMFGVSSNTLRQESWQFVNDDPDQPYPFKDIITPLTDTSTQRGSIDGGSRSLSEDYAEGDIFWPEGQKFDKNTPLRKAPYNVNITLNDFDFSLFDNDVTGDIRDIIIKNAIVSSKPYVGVYDESVSLNHGDNEFGTLNIVGGLVYEADGTTPINDSNGNQLTLETLIHREQIDSTMLPLVNDGYYVEDVDFTLNINHASLINYNLTVLGCIPDIAVETAALSERVNFDPIILRVGAMPNILEAQACVADSLARLRQDVTVENVQNAKAEIVACLESLTQQAEGTLCRAFFAGADPYSSTFEINKDLQFVGQPIEVTVIMKDRSGLDISKNLPEGCVSSILDELDGTVTLGTLSSFTYDNATSQFKAQIDSNVSGDGELRVSFQGEVFKEVVDNGEDTDTSVQERFLPYTFVGKGSTGTSAAEGGDVRRDATDVANNL